MDSAKSRDIFVTPRLFTKTICLEFLEKRNPVGCVAGGGGLSLLSSREEAQYWHQCSSPRAAMTRPFGKVNSTP